jgi:amino acid transporter
MLVAAMILIIQTAYLGSSRAMHSMSAEGNLPKFIGKTNRQGTPFVAMLIIGAFNLVLISMGNAAAILAASAIGYTLANGISLFAYVKAKKHPAFASLERPFKAPKGWKHVALTFGLFNVPLCVVGVVYLNSLEIGWTSTWVGFLVLALYLPIWFYTQHESRRASSKAAAARVPEYDAADPEKVLDPTP